MAGSVNGDDDSGIVDVDELQNHGIGATDILKLKQNGLHTALVIRLILLNSHIAYWLQSECLQFHHQETPQNQRPVRNQGRENQDCS